MNTHDDTLTPEDIAYQARLDALPKPGMRVQLVRDVERYPHFIAEAGRRGTVIEATEELFAVRLDTHLDGSSEWDNEVHWYPRNCDEWPEDDIEVLIPAITEAIVNIRSAIRVIAPLWESMHKFGHSQADDMAGAQAELEQAIRFLRNEEEAS